MIATCAQCGARYRIDREKIGPKGARLRCTHCGEVFRVVAPGQDEEPEPDLDPQRKDEERAAAPRAFPPSVARALVAETDVALAKRIAAYLETWNVKSVVVGDGGEALVRIFRFPPDLVVVGKDLPGVSGRNLIEILRRSEKLDRTALVRVTSEGDPDGPSEFDADEAVDAEDLPESLGPALAATGIGKAPAPRQLAGAAARKGAKPPPSVPRPSPSSPRSAGPGPASGRPAGPSDPAPGREGRAPRAAPARPSRGAEAAKDPRMAEAERLARIIVSDIILYNEDRFDHAARTGSIAKALQAELEEGRALFEARIPADIRTQRDFISEELERAAERRRTGASRPTRPSASA